MRHHQSRLVTLGENLAELVQVSGPAALAFGSLARMAVAGMFNPAGRNGRVRHHCQCCYEPPIHRCGGC